jgi:hypothetical protein
MQHQRGAVTLSLHTIGIGGIAELVEDSWRLSTILSFLGGYVLYVRTHTAPYMVVVSCRFRNLRDWMLFKIHAFREVSQV